MATTSPPRAFLTDSSFGGAADPCFDHVASLSSTPATTLADSESLASDHSKNDHHIASDPIDEPAKKAPTTQTPAETVEVETIVDAIEVTTTAPVQARHELDAPEPAAPADKPVGTKVTEAAEVTEPVHDPDSSATQPEVRALMPTDLQGPAQMAQDAAQEAATTNLTDVPNTPESARPRRSRASHPTYNLAKLSGTAIHGLRRSKGDVVSNRKRNRRPVASADIVLGSVEGQDATPASVEGQDATSISVEGQDATPASVEGQDATSASVEGQIATSVSVTKSPSKQVQDGVSAQDLQWSTPQPKTPKPRVPRKRAASPETEPIRVATRSSGTPVESLAQKTTSLGKRGKQTLDQGASNVSREVRRLRDTDEFRKIETGRVLYTTWAKGKLVTPQDPEPAKKKRKITSSPQKDAPVAETPVVEAPKADSPDEAAQPVVKPRRIKKWLDHGLYSGQDPPLDVTKHLTPSERKTLAEVPELMPTATPNKALPMPMYNGLRLLLKGQDFKLPFDVCNPLPPGQPKPDEWRKMTRNRFIGNASSIWKKMPHFNDYQSKCVCTKDDGCGDSCQNRIMLYECDTTNCAAGDAYCQNRAFARLQDRVKAGGKYRVGVEVVKTEDRGYGIRSNRCFQPNQIIMEYTGEIITEDECDRRMREKYKDNQCYYLMSFDQNMIIDATTGSIARFVNHSCTPNCRMIKWVVSGQPRMALFAGDRPIMTGEELTYDYNFDPFSAKNVQRCLCGSANCRGVLGPKPKEVKPPKPSKEELKKMAKNGVKTGKRKLNELIGDGEVGEGGAAKKRKTKPLAGTAKSKSPKQSLSQRLSGAGAKAAKGGAKMVKGSLSTIGAKGSLGSKSSSGRKLVTAKYTSSVFKTYSKDKAPSRVSTKPKKPKSTPKKLASTPPKKPSSVAFSASSSSPTIVAAGAMIQPAITATPVAPTTVTAPASAMESAPTPMGPPPAPKTRKPPTPRVLPKPKPKKTPKKPYIPTGRPRGRPRKYPRPEKPATAVSDVISSTMDAASADTAHGEASHDDSWVDVTVHEDAGHNAENDDAQAHDAGKENVAPSTEPLAAGNAVDADATPERTAAATIQATSADKSGLETTPTNAALLEANANEMAPGDTIPVKSQSTASAYSTSDANDGMEMERGSTHVTLVESMAA